MTFHAKQLLFVQSGYFALHGKGRSVARYFVDPRMG
jgi:hypothetical protein